MELIRNKFKKSTLLSITFFIMFTLNGCGKYFWDYECVWFSESPYVYMAAYTHTHKAIIEINGEKKEVETGWKNDGTGIEFCDPDIDNGTTEESIIWETECKIKKGKLYVTIIKDNVSDMEGQTIILEQQPLEDNDEE